MYEYSKYENLVKENLSESRFSHSKRVMDTALIIAKKFNIDPVKVKLSAILHDFTKEKKDTWQEKKLKESGLYEQLISQDKAIWHGFTAAYELEKNYELTDLEVLEAICNHTVGSENIGKVAMALYVADYIEPGRSHIDSNEFSLEKFDSIEMMVLKVAMEKKDYLLKKGMNCNENTLKMIKKLAKKTNKNF